MRSTANFEQPSELRRLRYIATCSAAAPARSRRPVVAARPWWGDGEHAWLFDNEQDLLDLDAEWSAST